MANGDERLQLIGEPQTFEQVAADYYANTGGAPSASYLGIARNIPANMTPEDLQLAYENDIITRLRSLDSTGDDYEMKVQEFFADLPDPNASTYPRVAAAAQAALARNKQGRQQNQSTLTLQAQLAEAGVSPDEIRQMRTADGKFDVLTASYKLGEIKRRGPTAATQPSESDVEALMPIYQQLSTGAFSDAEKVMALARTRGRNIDPSTPEGQEALQDFQRGMNDADWAAAYQARRDELLSQAMGYISFAEATGKNMSRLRSMFQPTRPTTSVTNTTAPAARPTSVPTGGTPPPTSSRFQSAESAARQAEAQREQQRAEGWTAGKNRVGEQLRTALNVQAGDDLQALANLIATDQRVQPDTTEIERMRQFGVQPYNAVAADAYLIRAGINPSDREPSTGRPYREVVKAWAEDIIGSAEAPPSRTTSTGNQARLAR